MLVGKQAPAVEYPDSDGCPMADNTLQFQWIVTIKENLDALLPGFVGGDLLWYAVEGEPKVRIAPDVLVALARPKGYRGSYKQWVEGGQPPDVAFEVLPPGNTAAEMLRKFDFYQRHGVGELYIYDPDRVTLDAFVREGASLARVPEVSGFVSPRLGVRFELGEDLALYAPSGARFRTFGEVALEAEAQKARADEEKARADEEKARADEEKARADALAAELAALRTQLGEPRR